MMMDFNKPYGEIFNSASSARFEQGGKFFDAQGHPVEFIDSAPVTIEDMAATIAEKDAKIASLLAALEKKKTPKKPDKADEESEEVGDTLTPLRRKGEDVK